VVALLIFVVGMLPSFSTDNLFDIAPTDAAGRQLTSCRSVRRRPAAFVYGIWFFRHRGRALAARSRATRARHAAASSSRC
jgi:ethanolamine permease